jgi:hypothetical protein
VSYCLHRLDRHPPQIGRLQQIPKQPGAPAKRRRDLGHRRDERQAHAGDLLPRPAFPGFGRRPEATDPAAPSMHYGPCITVVKLRFETKTEPVIESRRRFRSNSSHVMACLVLEKSTRPKHTSPFDGRRRRSDPPRGAASAQLAPRPPSSHWTIVAVTVDADRRRRARGYFISSSCSTNFLAVGDSNRAHRRAGRPGCHDGPQSTPSACRTPHTEPTAGVARCRCEAHPRTGAPGAGSGGAAGRKSSAPGARRPGCGRPPALL